MDIRYNEKQNGGIVMRLNEILKSDKTSPYLKRLVLMERAGLVLTKKQKKKLSEVVSMIEVPKYHNRLSPTHHLHKTFGNNEPQREEEIEIDVEDIIRDLEMDMELDEILREMGYEDDEDLLPTIDMDDLPDVSDEELMQVLKDLEYASGGE
jgi:hypothetical protein